MRTCGVSDVGVVNTLSTVGAILTVWAGIVAWLYQRASARLGVVDLFACEIGTLCRVVAVSEMASHLTQMFDTPPLCPLKFDSQEQYSPVFNNNSKDLESLEARVVGPVADFYTCFRAMRDYLRVLSAIEHPQDEVTKWHATVRSVTYMLFLMLENGREGIEELLEFEPEKAENTIMILLSELVAFKLLLQCFEGEGGSEGTPNARVERLQLRKERYPGIVRKAYHKAKDHPKAQGKDMERWLNATALLGELDKNYHDIFGAHIDKDWRMTRPR